MSVDPLPASVPADLVPLVAQRRWDELLTLVDPAATNRPGLEIVRGLALLGLRRFDEAAALLERGTAGTPGYGEMIEAYGLAHAQHGEAAIRRLAFLRANLPRRDQLALSPKTLRRPAPARLWAAAEELLGIAMIMGHRAESIEIARASGALFPGDAAASFMQAVTSGEDVPDAAPADYVRRHFDAFAPKFEKALIADLAYRTPGEMLAALTPWLERRGGGLRILDAGCGTGLCGPLFRPFAGFLAGADLSPCMLAVAEAKGCYDLLIEAELTELLAGMPGDHRVDLIVATDVAMYFGSLDALLAGASAALLPGGLFAFTVEAQAEPGFALHPTGRYKHGQAYVEARLAAAGFGPAAVFPTTIRNESGLPVRGFMLLAPRGAGA